MTQYQCELFNSIELIGKFEIGDEMSQMCDVTNDEGQSRVFRGQNLSGRSSENSFRGFILPFLVFLSNWDSVSFAHVLFVCFLQRDTNQSKV